MIYHRKVVETNSSKNWLKTEKLKKTYGDIFEVIGDKELIFHTIRVNELQNSKIWWRQWRHF